MKTKLHKPTLVKVAKLWPGNKVNWKTTTAENIWLLIKDSVKV